MYNQNTDTEKNGSGPMVYNREWPQACDIGKRRSKITDIKIKFESI